MKRKKPHRYVDRKKLGKRLRQLRIQLGHTQITLGKLYRTATNNISRYESGLVTPPLDYLVWLSRKVDVSLDWIITGTKSKKSS